MAQASRKGPSTRSAAADGGRVLDERARQRRQQRQLEDLERDNHAPDIRIDVYRLPEHPNPEKNTEKRRRQRKEITLQLSKKNLNQLLEEGVRVWAIRVRESDAPEAKLAWTQSDVVGRPQKRVRDLPAPNYYSILMPPSIHPPRHFCSVCGFEGIYACTQCGARYCSISCRDAHKDTRYERRPDTAKPRSS